MNEVKRVIIIVLDSMGVGELPDAAEYGDEGSNTLANTAQAVGGLSLPHMQKLGLGNIATIEGVQPCDEPLGAYGRMAEASKGKDTTTGHWEMAGIYSPRPRQSRPLIRLGYRDEEQQGLLACHGIHLAILGISHQALHAVIPHVSVTTVDLHPVHSGLAGAFRGPQPGHHGRRQPFVLACLLHQCFALLIKHHYNNNPSSCTANEKGDAITVAFISYSFSLNTTGAMERSNSIFRSDVISAI